MAVYEPQWVDASRHAFASIPTTLQPWLWEGHSMTQRMAAVSPSLRIRVLHERWDRPRRSEIALLNSQQLAWVRTITMNHGDTPWIAARSVIPRTACQHHGGQLQRLGTEPLGHILFQHPETKRAHLQWAHIKTQHHDHAWLQSIENNMAPYYWARRSVIIWQTHPILVNEFFLPALLKHLQHP